MTVYPCYLVTAGGTIDKRYPSDRGSYAFTFRETPAASDIVKRAGIGEIEQSWLPPKDSLDMTALERHAVRSACRQADQAFVVVTHGTDTMIETARVIASDNLPKTIVLTGALQPEAVKDTDADFNLGFAMAAAQLAPAGVYIAMHGRLFAWNRCEKTEAGIFVEKA